MQISGKDGLVMGSMVQFEPVRGRVPYVDPDCLKNQDEKLLLGYCLLVQCGPEADASGTAPGHRPE